MDDDTFCCQRDSFGGGYLCRFDYVSANENGGGYVHPFFYIAAVAVGIAAPYAQADARYERWTVVDSSHGNIAHSGVGDICPDIEDWHMVDFRYDFCYKYTEHLA